MIPITKLNIDYTEYENIKKVLDSRMLAQGEFVENFENKFANYCNVNYGVATNSGTSALHTALLALGIEKGDEVIVPDFTFIATANAVLMCGAKPVFADVDPDTMNISPESVVNLINENTKAVIGVHLFGQPFDVRLIQEICDNYNLYLIEDAAQAHGAKYNGQIVGSFGDIACFSFYATKNMITGEGGMCVTNDYRTSQNMRMIINHGQKEKYQHVMLGYNYRMNNITAAIGLAQLEKIDRLNNKRMVHAFEYNNFINNKKIIKPYHGEYHGNNVSHVYHQYVLKTYSEEDRNNLMSYLNKSGIATAIHYPTPITRQLFYRNQYLTDKKYKNEISNYLSKRVLSIPMYPDLTYHEKDHIIRTINSF